MSKNPSMSRIAVVLACLALVATACSRSNSSDSKGDEGGTSSSSAPPSKEGSASFGDLTDVCQGGSPSGSPATGVTPV
jgi:hypothetical protein